MPSIQHENLVHQAACAVAESTHQQAIAIATTAAACKAADIAFYRSVRASCKTNNLPDGQFVEALGFLGTGGA